MSAVARIKLTFKFEDAIRSWTFWSALATVIMLALLHNWAEYIGFNRTHPSLEFVPVSLYWFPVLITAMRFGFYGSGCIALLVVAVSIPNVIFLHNGVDRMWEMSQFIIIAGVSLLAGYLVDQRREAFERARLFARSALQSREEERKQISQDLHDDTIQALIVACRQLDGLRFGSDELPTSVSDKLKDIRDQLAGTSDDLRTITKRLRPPVLDDFGFVNSVNRLLEGLETDDGYETDLSVSGEAANLPNDVEVGLFRIIQEAVHNIERHAGASKVHVSVSVSSRRVSLVITDDGKGFSMPEDLKDLAQLEKFGLLGIYERGEILGGAVKVETGPQRGTTLRVTIPLDGAARDEAPPRLP